MEHGERMRKQIEDSTTRARGYMGRMMTRRSFVAGTAACSFVAGHVSDVLSDPWMEPMREAWRDLVTPPPVDTIDPTSTDVTNARLASMAGNPIANARDIAAETGGLNARWWEIAAAAGVLMYATRVTRRDDGKLVIVDHGDGLVLWGENAPEKMRGVPLDEQPDRKFGRFADRCMWEAMQRQVPALHARRAETIIKGHDRPRMLEYLAWTASDGEEAVSVALTLEQIARGRWPATPPRDTEAEDPRLLSHDATTPSRQAARQGVQPRRS